MQKLYEHTYKHIDEWDIDCASKEIKLKKKKKTLQAYFQYKIRICLLFLNISLIFYSSTDGEVISFLYLRTWNTLLRCI